jgi:hypothetical protein
LRQVDEKQAAQDLADNQRFPEGLKHQQALPAFLREHAWFITLLRVKNTVSNINVHLKLTQCDHFKNYASLG